MTHEQRGVAKGALPALVTALNLLVITYYLEIHQIAPFHLPLPVAVGLATLPLVYCIATIANKRYFHEEVIAGAAYDAPGSLLAIDKAVTQNTIEQTILAFSTYSILAYVLPELSTALLPTLLFLFIVGRICFIAGYKYGAGGRAFGFGLTAYPTILTLLGSILFWFFQ